MDASPIPELPRHQRVVDAFRGGGRTLGLHPREKLILGIVAVHLGFLAWAFGGRNFWAQNISLGLAVAGFIAALLPREIPRTVDQPGMRLIPWIRLRRSVLFWAGLGIMLLVTIQGLNPAWTFHLENGQWWMTQLPFRDWLPRGVEVIWTRGGGPWHTLIVWASAWLTACTVLIGLTRRRALRILLVTIAANGVGIALLGLAERLFGNGKIYWMAASPNLSFFASFVYKNHAGTWLNLCLGAAVGLAGWHYLRSLRRMEKSNPSGVFLFLSTILAASVFVSFARGAALMMLIFVGVAIAAFVLYQFFVPKALQRPVIAILLIGLFGVFLKSGLDSLRAEVAWARFNQAFSEGDTSLRDRQLVTRAAVPMHKDHWLWGTGAGSFRFLFPPYQKRIPEIRSVIGAPAYWEHAHNDLLEFSIELGLPGLLAVLAMAGTGIVALIRHGFWKNAVSLALVLALGLTTVHAWWEFVFQNTAILVLYCTLCVVAVMWARFEEGS